MDIKDAKVGMLVQFNPDYTGTMWYGLKYMKETGEPLRVSSVSQKYIRVRYKGAENGFYPEAFVPYQDPEADMVVWDALEFGEHFMGVSPVVGYYKEAVKLTPFHYVVLGEHALYVFHNKHVKVKLA